MSYYILKEACDTPETGSVYPQIQKLKPGYDKKKQDSIYSFLKRSISSFPDDIPDLDSFILEGKAKPTDLISNTITSGSGFFVSEKLKAIFEKHCFVPHRFYQAKVIYKGETLENYFWMHIISDMTDLVDYSHSTFFIYKHYRLNDGYIKINSKEEYLDKSKQLKKENPGINITVWSEKLHLTSKFDRKLDGFGIGLFDANFYISQSLKESLIKNHITGCKMEPTDRIML